MSGSVLAISCWIFSILPMRLGISQPQRVDVGFPEFAENEVVVQSQLLREFVCHRVMNATVVMLMVMADVREVILG